MTIIQGDDPVRSLDGFSSFEIMGAEIRYACRGTGEPVLLAHGALGDLRSLLPVAERLADDFEAITLSLPALSASERPGRPFGTGGQAEDLLDFIRLLGRGPVHLVAWSYSAHAALALAVRHPEWIRSLLLYEPGFPTFVEEQATVEAIEDDMASAFAGAAEAFAKGLEREAVRVAIDAAAMESGYFDRQPESRRMVHLDNAGSLEALFEQQLPTPIRSSHLASIGCPATVAGGSQTRTCYRLVTDAASRAMGAGCHMIVDGAGHLLPEQDAGRFALLVREHLASLGKSRPPVAANDTPAGTRR